MFHRRRKSSSGVKFIVLTAIVALLAYGIYWSYNTYVAFNPQAILDNSVFKSKSFDTPAVEIIAPKSKIKAYLIEDKTNPIISISFLFKNAGLASDDENKQGISNLVSSLLLEGAGSRDALSLKEEMENQAIGITFDVSSDDFTGNLVTTKDSQEIAYGLLNDILTKPMLAVQDIERIKLQMQYAFLRQKEHPASLLRLEFAKFIYGYHPYGRNPLGDWNNIKNTTREDLLKFINNHFTKNNLIIGIAGDVSPEQTGIIVDQIFGNLPASGAINFVRNAEVDFSRRVKNIEQKTGQNISSFASLGVSRNDADFYPLYIANHIFGGAGLSSRISKAVREKEGLTYSIYSYMSLNDKSPLLQGGFSSTANNYQQVWNILDEQWELFGQAGANAEELGNAKNYLISSYNLRFASITNLSDILMSMQKENLGLDFLQKRNENVAKVTLDDVNNAAKKYFKKDKMLIVNIGSFAN